MVDMLFDIYIVTYLCFQTSKMSALILNLWCKLLEHTKKQTKNKQKH